MGYSGPTFVPFEKSFIQGLRHKEEGKKWNQNAWETETLLP